MNPTSLHRIWSA